MIRLLVMLPRLLAAAVIAAIGAAGVLLILEAVGSISAEWRDELSRSLTDFAVADWAGWAIALIGVGLGACAVVLGLGLFTTARPGGRRLFVVSSNQLGETRLRGRAVRTALRERLREHPAVLDARTSLMRRKWVVDVDVADNVDLVATDREARALTGADFWDQLGITPARIDLRFHLRDVVALGTERASPFAVDGPQEPEPDADGAKT